MTEDKYDSTLDTLEHIRNVQRKLLLMIGHLMERAFNHDKSKLEAPEKDMYDKYTPELKRYEFGTSAYNDTKRKMGDALTHHYQENRHHPQYFIDGVDGMNLLDLMEMLADWKCASERMKSGTGDIRKSIEINAKDFHIDEQLKQILLNTASYMEWI